MILRSCSLAVRRSVGSGFLFDPRICRASVVDGSATKAVRRRPFATAKDPQRQGAAAERGGAGWRAAWDRFLAPKEIPPRNTLAWYREMALICTVFAITGTSTMVLVRPAVSKGLGIQGSLKDGPWTYRICSLVIMSPIYGMLLVLVGTAFGRHSYFRHFSVKMFSRFGIPPELLDPTFHQTKKTFRKW